MATKSALPEFDRCLGEEERSHILEVFSEEVETKLKRLHARVGNLNCSFAGGRYKNWNVRFRSRGPGFEIVEFFYDEKGSELDLDI